jgi:cell division protease FtsH
MVTRYGMSDALGTMVYAENEGEVFLGRSVTRQTSVSEETQRKVDGEIRRIIDEQYALARKLIEENRDKIEAMTKALLEFETIDADQIKDIMEGREVRPPKPSTMRFQPKRDGDGASGGSAEAAKPAVKEPPAAEGVQ